MSIARINLANRIDFFVVGNLFEASAEHRREDLEVDSDRAASEVSTISRSSGNFFGNFHSFSKFVCNNTKNVSLTFALVDQLNANQFEI